jgi:hypothetical protein
MAEKPGGAPGVVVVAAVAGVAEEVLGDGDVTLAPTLGPVDG